MLIRHALKLLYVLIWKSVCIPFHVWKFHFQQTGTEHKHYNVHLPDRAMDS